MDIGRVDSKDISPFQAGIYSDFTVLKPELPLTGGEPVASNSALHNILQQRITGNYHLEGLTGDQADQVLCDIINGLWGKGL